MASEYTKYLQVFKDGFLYNYPAGIGDHYFGISDTNEPCKTTIEKAIVMVSVDRDSCLVRPVENGQIQQKESRLGFVSVKNLFAIYASDTENCFSARTHVNSNDKITIGSSKTCNIVLNSYAIPDEIGTFTYENGQLIYNPSSRRVRVEMNNKPINNYKSTVMNPYCILKIEGIFLFINKNVIHLLKINTSGDIHVYKLSKRRGSNYYLRPTTCHIRGGELVAILGTTGAGKTTFINCIMGSERKSDGRVILGVLDISNSDDRKSIGYVPQADILRPSLTVDQTLKYAAKLRLPASVSLSKINSIIADVMADLKLNKNILRSKFSSLSGGEKRRVNVAHELVADPQVIFLDEPTSGLDPKTETTLVNFMKDYAHNRGKTMIVVTHTIHNLNQYDRVLFFARGGRLCYNGRPANLCSYFGVDNIETIYEKLTDEQQAQEYYDLYNKSMGE